MSHKHLTADDLKVGQWVWLDDEMTRCVKVEGFDRDHNLVALSEEDGVALDCGHIEGDCNWHHLPLYGFIQP